MRGQLLRGLSRVLQLQGSTRTVCGVGGLVRRSEGGGLIRGSEGSLVRRSEGAAIWSACRSCSTSAYQFVEPVEGVDTLQAVDVLCRREGYLTLRGLFSAEEVGEARRIIRAEVGRSGGRTVTHFHGAAAARPDLQARTWNLLNKGEVFERMVQHPVVLEIGRDILGDDLQLGSIAANTLLPGATGQEPHLDYPYWDMYSREHWPQPPKHPEQSFYMCLMATVMLDDFTVENGATALVPYSQLEAVWPDSNSFKAQSVRCTGQAGDVLMFVGTLQHASMPNNSDASRTGVLIQYLPKYVRPMEDQQRMLTSDVLSRATPTLRRLLTLDYPYPAVMEDLGAGNSEGSASDFKWK